MAKETKMIIITSNEDLIRQFSLKNPTNTLIIDLDNEKQTSSKRKNNDEIIDLALLAQLSEPVCSLILTKLIEFITKNNFILEFK